ncbi:MAG TPA: TonB-dependent receptor [Allosphingosinicella sp.]|nr:TonB-dependent receptor [Allosphingosinicella sp.]
MLSRTMAGLVTAWALAMGPPAAAAVPRHAVAIRAGSLSSALHDLARQTGTDLLFDEASVRGLPAPALRGRLSVETALRHLLGGSGLRARRTASGAFVIERRAAAPPSAPEDKPAVGPEDLPVPDILIVGKRTQNVDIRRRQDDVQPYRVTTGREIVRAHRDNLEQYFRSRVTQNTQVVPPSLLEGGKTNSQIDLRGLGSDGTLILLDGRRLPSIPSSPGTFDFEQPDLNGVPLHAIERVETLTGTAGGIYGFGALGGVVNVILKRDYSGLDLHATAGISSRGDSRRVGLEGRFGVSPDGGRSGMMLFLSHSRTRPLFVGQRRYVLRDIEGSSRFAPERVVAAGQPTNSIGIFSFTGEDLVFRPEYGGAPLGSTHTFLPLGFAGTATDLAQALAGRAGQLDVSVPEGRDESEIGSSPNVTSGMLNLRHRFSDRIEAFADAVFLRNRGRHLSHDDHGSLFLFPGSAANPFEQFLEVRFPVPGRSVEVRTIMTTQRYTAGLIASLPARWRGTAEATFGSASFDFRSSNENYFNGPLFIFGGEPLNPLGPWDAFLAAAAAPEYRRSAYSDFERHNRYEEQSLRLAGPLFDAAGGPVTLTLLAERRREKVPATTVSMSSDTMDSETEYASQSGRSTSFYGELRAPVGGASAPIPLLRNLELQLAVRRDGLRVSFATNPGGPLPLNVVRPRFRATGYTAGAKSSPWPWLMLRGSYATGAQPPALGELVPIEFDFNLAFLTDPRRGNSFFSDEGRYLYITGGSPDLDVVRASTLSLGAVLTPFGEDGPILSLDYSRIRRTGDALRLNESFVLAHEADFPERVTRLPLTEEDRAKGYTAGKIAVIDARTMNGTSRTVRSLDARLEWPLRLLGGRLRASALATLQMGHLRKDLFEPGLELIGYRDTPLRWRANGGLEWTRGETTVGANIQYFDDYRISYAGLDGELAILHQGSPRVRGQTYVDLFASRRFRIGGAGSDRELSADLGIVNLFDASPPRQTAAEAPGPGYSPYGDPRRRRFELVLSYGF